jgi:valyl-tRNA synthetase
VPFKDVIIHPTVLAADGRRMSKSLGTGVDPLELIADYGADATRFGLVYMSSAQDVRFSAERIEMGRNFANKLWNAARLVFQGAHPAAVSEVELATVADRWIFSRLAEVSREVATLYEAYDFDDVARVLYRFVWNEVCDWYLEIVKPRLYGEGEKERLRVSGNLLVLIEQVALLLHPVMPFITEELFSNLPADEAGSRPGSIFDARYPEPSSEWRDEQAEAAMENFIAVVAGLRSTREELGLARDTVGRIRLVEEEPGAAMAIREMPQALSQLCACEVVESDGEKDKQTGRSATVGGAGVKALLDLEGLVDLERERARLVNKARKASAEAAKARGKLEKEAFLAKAPAEVVAEERARLALAETSLAEAQVQYRERIGGELPVSEETRS